MISMLLSPLWGNSPVPSQSAHLLRGITYGPHALCNFNYSMDSIFFNKFTIVLYKKRPDFSGCFCLKIDYNGFCGSQCFWGTIHNKKLKLYFLYFVGRFDPWTFVFPEKGMCRIFFGSKSSGTPLQAVNIASFMYASFRYTEISLPDLFSALKSQCTAEPILWFI